MTKYSLRKDIFPSERLRNEYIIQQLAEDKEDVITYIDEIRVAVMSKQVELING